MNMPVTKPTAKKKTPLLRADMEIGRITLNDKAVFAKNLSMMLKSGLSLNEAFDVLYRTTANGKLRNILGELNQNVKSGGHLSESLARYPRVFSGFFIGSVYAGEASGTLSENLDKVAIELAKDRELYARIANSLIYPLFVLVAAMGLGLFVVFFVLPKILPMFGGLHVKLPLTTVILIAVAKFLALHGAAFIAGLVALVIALIWLLRQKWLAPFSHGLLLKLPLLDKMTLYINLSRFFRVLATMLASGLNIVEALDVSAKTLNNYHYRAAIAQIRKAVDKGARLADVFSRYKVFFPEICLRMIVVGEQTGRLEETLYYLADYYEGEIDGVTKRLATFIELALLLIIGFGVGFLALAIITPIYNITGKIAR